MSFAIKVWNQRQIRIRPEDRYVCLTDMAKATGKQVSHWTPLQNTTAFVQALSDHTGIPVCEIITTSKDNTIGTWAHPQVAIDFAGWCCPKFKVQVTSWIDELLTTGFVSLGEHPQVATTAAVTTSKELIELLGVAINTSYEGLDLKPELLAGLKLNAIELHVPELIPLLAESRQLLINNTAQEFELLTATGFSEYKINLTGDLTAYCLFQIDGNTLEISGLVFSLDQAAAIEDYVRAEVEIREHLKANAVSLITCAEDYDLHWI